MRVLIVGSGGREDALAWRFARDGAVSKVASVPGNPGTLRWGRNLSGGTLDAARSWKPDLVVIGSEDDLASGLSDDLRAEGFAVVGPSRMASRLETSKTHGKEFAERYSISTARWKACEDAAATRAAAEEFGRPCVVKVDGLARGKGTFICEDESELSTALSRIFEKKEFGSDQRVVVEEFLQGEELSVHLLVSDDQHLRFPDARDYKKLLNGNRGPNTGGMGAYSPVKLSAEIEARVEEEIIAPVIKGLAREEPYRGLLYIGIILTADGPKVLEFNCRFGDPEAQVILPRITQRFAETMLACATGELAGAKIEVDPEVCTGVIVASEGYPRSPRTGLPVNLPDPDPSNPIPIFYSGLKEETGRLVTASGRICTAVAMTPTGPTSAAASRELASTITFPNRHFRTDIGE